MEAIFDRGGPGGGSPVRARIAHRFLGGLLNHFFSVPPPSLASLVSAGSPSAGGFTRRVRSATAFLVGRSDGRPGFCASRRPCRVVKWCRALLLLSVPVFCTSFPRFHLSLSLDLSFCILFFRFGVGYRRLVCYKMVDLSAGGGHVLELGCGCQRITSFHFDLSRKNDFGIKRIQLKRVVLWPACLFRVFRNDLRIRFFVAH